MFSHGFLARYLMNMVRAVYFWKYKVSWFPLYNMYILQFFKTHCINQSIIQIASDCFSNTGAHNWNGQRINALCDTIGQGIWAHAKFILIYKFHNILANSYIIDTKLDNEDNTHTHKHKYLSILNAILIFWLNYITTLGPSWNFNLA